MKIIVIFSCSGMFRNVPACSGMFRVPGFIDGLVFCRTLTNFIGTPSDCRRLLAITCSCAVFRFSKKVRPHLYRESLSRVEGSPSPPSWVNFCDRFYEKKVVPFARANSTQACSDCLKQDPDCLALTELTRLGEPKCLFKKMFAQLGGDQARRDVITGTVYDNRSVASTHKLFSSCCPSAAWLKIKQLLVKK